MTEVLPACKGKYQCLGTRMSAVALAGDHVFEEINGHLMRSDGTRERHRLYGTGLVRVDPAQLRRPRWPPAPGGLRQGVRSSGRPTARRRGRRRSRTARATGRSRVQGPPISFDGALFVAADRKPVGQQLWRIAGGQTTAVTDLPHLATGIYPFQALAVGDRILLSGAEFSTGKVLPADGSVRIDPDYDDVCSLAFPPILARFPRSRWAGAASSKNG